MAFRFRLQALLRLRQGLERQEELGLQAIHQELQNLRAELNRVRQCMRDAQALQAEGMQSGLTGAELRFSQDCLKARDREIERLGEAIRNMEVIRERQTLVFRKARQDREILDHLRDQQWHDYSIQEARAMQRQLDELFLLRKKNAKRG